MDTSDLAVIGLLVTGIGLLINGYQVRQAKQVALGQFLLQFDQMFIPYREIQRALFPGGPWSGGLGPSPGEEMADTEAYIGLLERLAVLIEKGVIDKRVADRLYGYRVRHILRNPVIRMTILEDEASDWTDFIKLCRLLDYEKDLPEKARNMLSQETSRYGN